MLPFLAIGSFAIEANVADLPINFAVRSHLNTRHTVPAKANVYTVAVRNGRFRFGYAIAVFVFHAPQIGRNGYVQIIAIGHDAPGDIGHLVMEVVHNQLRLVGNAIAGSIFDPEHVFFLNGHVPPVVRAIAVQIFQPIVFLAVFRR